MAASSIDAFVVTFEDTEPRRANISLSYELFIRNGIRALSTNTNGNNDVGGFLYHPDYPEGSSCVNQTSQFIPQNVTRRNDIPDRFKKPPLVALAPWTSPECVLSLLTVVQNAVTAFIFYIPSSPAGMPPPTNNPVWGLGDGGSWKSKNKYPVYAISGVDGSSIMTQLGLYSGALMDAPNGSLLQDQLGPSYTARMYAVVELSETTSLPSLWAFLLIVLGIVLFLIGLTSSIMHLYQRRRRNALRRRIVNGEVDLERLGIKRLTVPQEAIDMLPQFVYSPSEKDLLDRPRDHITALSDFPVKESDTDRATFDERAPTPPTSTESSESAKLTSQQPADPASLIRSPPVPSISPPPPTFPSPYQANSNVTTYAQPTCPICLDDFTPHTTIVRSLPCHHIYHPECIDPFLLQSSSLCPVCKSKVLPKGYCPSTITNAMVRRERQQRRNRDRVRRIRGEEAAAQMPVAAIVEPRQNRLLAVQGRMASFHRQFGRVGRSSSSTQNQAPASPPPAAPSTAVEMRNLDSEAVAGTSPPPATAAAPASNTPATVVLTSPPAAQQPEQADPSPAAATRSERARRRASLFMREQEPTAEDQDQERWARLPRWRKAIKSLFPGF
ncbi:MAG: hypothetical protein Q9225_000852 [Loekoesia sp. 1 TL-2023]